MKPQVRVALITVLGLLLLLAAIACGGESETNLSQSEVPQGAGSGADAGGVVAPASSEDLDGLVVLTNPDGAADGGGDSGTSLPSSGSGDGYGPSGSSSSSSSSGDSDVSVGQSNPPDNVVYGTIEWPAMVTPPPGSVLEVSLLDVSLQDAPAEFIVGQVILDPGEGPVDFYLEFDPEDIKPENIYAVEAALSDPRGTLMYINDVAYDVLTWGNANYVDVELVAAFDMPMPPPDGPGDGTTAGTGAGTGDGTAGGGQDGSGLAEIPAPIVGVEVGKLAEGYRFTATYLRPAEPGCGELSSYGHEAAGDNIYLDINLTPWQSCGEPTVAEEMEFPLEFPFEPGMSYWVITNGEQTNRFSLPEAGFPPYVTIPSTIASVEWNVMESFPPQYSLWVVTEMHQGSGCSRFNGYDITRSGPYRFEIALTHHVVDFSQPGGMVACTADIAIEETAIHLGADFEPGREYTVVVNTETVTIVAQ